MGEIPRPFDSAQDRLQAKRKFVMPAKPVPDLDRGAGIQVGARGCIRHRWIPAKNMRE